MKRPSGTEQAESLPSGDESKPSETIILTQWAYADSRPIADRPVAMQPAVVLQLIRDVGGGNEEAIGLVYDPEGGVAQSRRAPVLSGNVGGEIPDGGCFVHVGPDPWSDAGSDEEAEDAEDTEETEDAEDAEEAEDAEDAGEEDHGSGDESGGGTERAVETGASSPPEAEAVSSE